MGKKFCALFHQHIAGDELVYYDTSWRKREVYIQKTVYLWTQLMLNAVGELFMKFQFHIGWIIIKKRMFQRYPISSWLYVCLGMLYTGITYIMHGIIHGRRRFVLDLMITTL